jgi:hypothetical protein
VCLARVVAHGLFQEEEAHDARDHPQTQHHGLSGELNVCAAVMHVFATEKKNKLLAPSTIAWTIYAHSVMPTPFFLPRRRVNTKNIAAVCFTD